VEKYHLSPKDAWDTTLREFLMIVEGGKKQPIRGEHDRTTQRDIMEHFALMDLQKCRD